MNLVVVESPAKAKTIAKYLGPDFEVVASYGHVRDLIPKEGAVDPEDGFKMTYQLIERNEKHVQTISKKLKGASALYLATDPDREGEAISWHLYELLKSRRQIGDRPVYRVVFNEITKHAVQEAVANPRHISDDLVNAQQARRALDYLVGFNLSPLLWKKIRRGLSAGRVQSPALRMICEREIEIEAFQVREYWTIEADAAKDGKGFNPRLTQFEGARVEQFSIVDEARAQAVRKALEQAAGGVLTVDTVERKQRKRNPAPPFTTSTLQQEAARKLGFTAQRTMRVAQQLYEGVDVGGGATGLISYMRTDSVNLSQEALGEIRDYVAERYGADHLPSEARLFKTKAKNAQEAHEAIRPTSIRREPAAIKEHLSAEQAKLYELIWKRTVACQMAQALIDTVAVDLSCGQGNQFRATGSTVTEPGFMAVYLEGRDDAAGADDDEDRMLPAMEPGDRVDLVRVRPEQHFTEPPPRFTEASLVKALEEYGIGRPSTYASIISTLQEREYVTLEKKRFTPTDVGRIVNRFLTEYFTPYVDYDFTARLEDELDAVSRGEEDWVPVLENFWRPFKERVDHTQENVKRSDVTQEATGRGLSQVRQPLVHPPGAQRALRRVHQVPGVRLHPRSQLWRRGRPPGTGGGAQLPGVRLDPGGQARQVRQVHRLQRLPQVPLHRAPGKARGHRCGLPPVRQGDPPEEEVQARQDLLLLLDLPGLRLCGVGRAHRPALSSVRLARPDPQGHAQQRHRAGLPAEGLRLPRPGGRRRRG